MKTTTSFEASEASSPSAGFVILVIRCGAGPSVRAAWQSVGDVL